MESRPAAECAGGREDRDFPQGRSGKSRESYMESRVQIKIIRGACSRREFDISLPCLIGRSHNADIRLTDPDVSGRHALLTVDDSKVLYIRNLSKGSTIVGGKTLARGGEIPVTAQTLVSLGESVEILIAGGDVFGIPEDGVIFFNDPEDMTAGAVSHCGKSCVETETLSFFVEHRVDRAHAGVKGGMARFLNTAGNTLRKQLPGVMRGVLLLLIAAVCSGAGYFAFAAIQENELSYSFSRRDLQADEIISPVKGPEWGISFYFPRHAEMKVVRKSDSFAAETRIGSLCSIPLHLEYHGRSSTGILLSTKEKVFEKWIKETAGKEWQFDRISRVRFFGENNGFPYLTAEYRRKVSSEYRFGIATSLKFRDRQFIFLKEIPLKERKRGEKLLRTETFFKVAPEIISRYWDVNVPLLDLPAEEMLERSKKMLSRVTPGVWGQTYQLLVSSLIKAHSEKNSETADRAELLLADMRKMQRRWLNAQRIDCLNSIAKGDHKTAYRVKKNCERVFSDKNDQWAHLIRNNFGE